MSSRSVVISVLVHVLVLAAAIIAPITASDVLPSIQSPIRPFLRAFRAADIALPAPSIHPRTLPHVATIPIVAPNGFAPERPQGKSPATVEVPFAIEGLPDTGVPDGFPTTGTVVPPPPPPPAATKNAAPLRVGSGIKAPLRVAYVAPLYPAIALSSRVEGNVTIEAIIGVDGSVENLKIVRGLPLLNDAALEAVSRWRYSPTLLNGVPVPVVMTVTVSFRLR